VKWGEQSQELATALLFLSSTPTRRYLSRIIHITLVMYGNGCVDRELEQLLYTCHLLATALDVLRSHSFSDCSALFCGNRSETLCLKEFDAVAFVAEVGFEAHEDERGCGAEVKDFGIPLE